MKKKCLLLTLLLAFCFALPAAAAENNHEHCFCGETHSKIGDHTTEEKIAWTAWEQTGSLPTEEGNYYLTDDVTPPRGGSFEVTNSIHLCLNGHTIKGAIKVTNTGALTITDCQQGTGKLTKWQNGESGNSGVTVQGTFQFYNGTITENGRGVNVESGGTFNMYGGSITENGINSMNGAGVQVGSNCTFRMYGGTISANSGRNGGGVFVSNWGTFEMYGGAIQNNTVTDLGGGVYLAGTFHLKGSGTITGNKKGEDANNVYLDTGKTITVGEKVTDAGTIGITVRQSKQGTRIYTGVTDVSGISMDDDGKTISKYGYLKIGDCTDGAHTPTEDKTECVVCEKPLYYTNADNEYFSDLSAAVQSVRAGDTITLLRNVSLSGYEVKNDVTLDLNGHELNSTNENTAALTIGTNGKGQAATLTVKNSGDTNGKIYKVVFQGGILAVDGKVMFQSFENQVADKHIIDFIAEGYAIVTKKGELVKANGNSLTEGDYAVQAHTCNFETDDYICACGRACPHKNLAGNYCYGCGGVFEAKIGDHYYKTLSEAVEAVAENGTATIELLGDSFVTSPFTISNKTVTIDGQEAGVMSGGANEWGINGQTITVTGGRLTLKNVKYVAGLHLGVSADCVIEGTTEFGTLEAGDNGAGTIKTMVSLSSGSIFVDKSTGEYQDLSEVSSATNIKVAKCAHTEPNEMGMCAQCGLPVQAKIGTTYYTSLSEALNTAASGDTVTLLTDVTSYVEVNGKQDKTVTLDLNEKNINAELYIGNSTSGGFFTCKLIGDGRVQKLNVDAGGTDVKLYGGTYGEINCQRNLCLPDHYGYYEQTTLSSKKWYTGKDTDIPSKNLTVAKLPIQSVAIAGEDSVDYDDSITLVASALYAGQPAESDITYAWYVETGISPVDTGRDLDFSPQVQAIAPGSVNVGLTVTVDGYSLSAEKVLTVNKEVATYQDLVIWENLVYNGEARDLLIRGVFTNSYGCVVYYRLRGETDWKTDFSAIKAADARTYTVEWYLKGTDYYADNGSAEEPNTVTVTIAPAEVGVSGWYTIRKTYDGTTAIDADTLKSLKESYYIHTSLGDRLNYPADYTMTAMEYVGANAAGAAYYTVTFTLTNPNYVFTDSSAYQKVSDTEVIYQGYGQIEKAPFPINDRRGEITIINDKAATYTLENISSLLPDLPAGCTWGKVSFGTVACENGEGSFIPYESATVENGTLIFNTRRDHSAEKEGKLGCLRIRVTTGNYTNGYIDVDIYAKNKPEAEVTVTILRDMIYGERFGAFNDYTVTAVDKVSGAEVAGTLIWETNTNIVPPAGTFTANWSFSPEDDDTYKKTKGSVTITVQKATPEIKVTPVTEAGKILADVTVSVLCSGNQSEGTLVWTDKNGEELPADTVISANTTYCCTFIPADTANYERVSAETVLYAVSASSGRFQVTTPETVTGGTVRVPEEKVKEGSTVTITVTPEAGYVIDKVTVKTKWSVIEVTDNGDGSFSFTQPAGSVTVTPTFKKVGETPAKPDNSDNQGGNGNNNGNNGGSTGLPVIPVTPANPVNPTEKREWTNSFSDVTEENWYFEAVKYVYEIGLMNGRTEDRFDAAGEATREQFISVLWRLAGSPEATVTAEFTDLLAGEYYIPAISWAVEKGIVNGYDDGRFGVGDPITREQLATMLYRYEKSIGGGFVGAWAFRLNFSDIEQISDWAWEAMCWCNMKGILGGRGDGTLDPQGIATRAELAKVFTVYQNLER